MLDIQLKKICRKLTDVKSMVFSSDMCDGQPGEISLMFTMSGTFTYLVGYLACVQLFANFMDCSSPGNSVHEFSARTLEWLFPSSGSSQRGSCVSKKPMKWEWEQTSALGYHFLTPTTTLLVHHWTSDLLSKNVSDADPPSKEVQNPKQLLCEVDHGIWYLELKT